MSASTTRVGEGSSGLQTFWNAFNAVEGSGLLGIPYAVSKLGLCGGSIAIVGTALVSSFTALQLSELASSSLDSNSGGAVVGYEEIAEKAFGYVGRRIIAAILYAELIGVVGIFLTLCASSLSAIGWPAVSPQCRLLLAASLTVPWLMLRDLRALSWLSLLGVISLTACLLTILQDAIHSPHGIAFVATQKLVAPSMERWEAVGVIVFSFAAHGQFPALRAGMAKPGRFGSVLLATFVAATSVKLLFGVGAVMGYGVSGTPEMVVQAMSNTFHRTCCAALVLINTFFRLPLPILAAAKGLEQRGINFFAARMGILALASLLAALVPGFAHLMGSVGLLTGTALVFVLPPLFELKLRHSTTKRTRKQTSLCLLLLVSAAAGVWTTMAISHWWTFT